MFNFPDADFWVVEGHFDVIAGLPGMWNGSKYDVIEFIL